MIPGFWSLKCSLVILFLSCQVLVSQDAGVVAKEVEILGIDSIAIELNRVAKEEYRSIVALCHIDEGGEVVSINGSIRDLKGFLVNDYTKSLGGSGRVWLVVGIVVRGKVPTREELKVVEDALVEAGVEEFSIIPFRLELKK